MENKDENGFTFEEIQKFMKLAIQEANKAFECDEVPVGCIFVTKTKENPEWKVVAQSHNLTNSLKNSTRHCEINCMHQMQGKISHEEHENLILFVSVEPCIMCTYALNIFKVKYVYFGQFNDKFGGCGSVLKKNTFDFRGGILAEESYQMIKQFYERGNQRLSEDMRNKRRKKNENENGKKNQNEKILKV